ncbi:MAG: hypothetical protein ACJA1F_001316 [Paracoccaceae bacterium]|jgi:hypothetical protein
MAARCGIHQTKRRRIGPEYLAWVWLECQNGKRAGLHLSRKVDHGAVPKVHTIEITYGGARSAIGRGYLRKGSNDPHGGELAFCRSEGKGRTRQADLLCAPVSRAHLPD